MMLKETKNTMQERAFDDLQDMNDIESKANVIRVFFNLMYSAINNEILDKEINLVYIGTFKLQKRNGKKSNSYYTKVIYSKKLRENVKKKETQLRMEENYTKNYLTIIPFEKLVQDTLLSFGKDPIESEHLSTRFYVYKILDDAYNVFKETFFKYLFEGYMIDMGNKILHIGQNKKYGYVLSQKSKQAQLLAMNKKIETTIEEESS